MENLLEEGEKIAGKKWKAEKKTLKKTDIPNLKKEIGIEVGKLAFWEVIDYCRQFYDKSIEPRSMEARLYRKKELSDELYGERAPQRTQQQTRTKKKSNEQEL